MQSCGANFVNEDGEAYIVGNDVAEKCINLYVDLVKNLSLIHIDATESISVFMISAFFPVSVYLKKKRSQVWRSSTANLLWCRTAH